MDSITYVQSLHKPVLTKVLFLAIALVLIVSLSVAQVQAKTSTVTSSFRIELGMQMFVPCANNGAGEYVMIAGPLNVVFVTTLDNQGGYQSKYELQFKGVTGTGLTTGTIYQATEGTQGTFDGKIGSTRNLATSLKMVNQSGGSFLLHETVQATVGARGVVTASIGGFSVTCKRPSYPG